MSGSDKVTTTETERLQRLGLRFHEQHLAEHADAADLVVFSSAIKDDNPILLTARSCGKPLFRRAEALAAIMQAKRGIVIAGMHGKTTTSAMTAHVLREGGLVNAINADGAAFRVPALPVEWNGASIGDGLKVPVLGADTAAILSELEPAAKRAAGKA